MGRRDAPPCPGGGRGGADRCRRLAGPRRRGGADAAAQAWYREVLRDLRPLQSTLPGALEAASGWEGGSESAATARDEFAQDLPALERVERTLTHLTPLPGSRLGAGGLRGGDRALRRVAEGRPGRDRAHSRRVAGTAPTQLRTHSRAGGQRVRPGHGRTGAADRPHPRRRRRRGGGARPGLDGTGPGATTTAGVLVARQQVGSFALAAQGGVGGGGGDGRGADAGEA